MNTYKLIEADFSISIQHVQTGYELELVWIESDLARHVRVRMNCGRKDCQVWLGVTSRDLGDYIKAFAVLAKPLVNNHRYIEVGAGLGGFIPHIAKHTRQPPTVIDGADYQRIHDMLSYAVNPQQYERLLGHAHPGIKTLFQETTKPRIRTLMRRCETLLNPDKVNLINLPLSKALRYFPGIVASGDVVIDLYGAVEYPRCDHGIPAGTHQEEHSRVLELEERLVAPGGFFLHFP